MYKYVASNFKTSGDRGKRQTLAHVLKSTKDNRIILEANQHKCHRRGPVQVLDNNQGTAAQGKVDRMIIYISELVGVAIKEILIESLRVTILLDCLKLTILLSFS